MIGVAAVAGNFDIYLDEDVGFMPFEIGKSISEGKFPQQFNPFNGPLPMLTSSLISEVSGNAQTGETEEALERFFIPSQIERLRRVLKVPHLNEFPSRLGVLNGQKTLLTKRGGDSGSLATPKNLMLRSLGFRTRSEEQESEKLRERVDLRRNDNHDRRRLLELVVRARIQGDSDTLVEAARELQTFYPNNKAMAQAIAQSYRAKLLPPSERVERSLSPRLRRALQEN